MKFNRCGKWMPDLVFPSADGNRVILEHKLTVYWYIVAFPVQKKLKRL